MNRMTHAWILCGAIGTALLGGCGPGLNGATPVEPTPECVDLSGSYRATFSTSCGQSATTIPDTVTQDRCTFSTTIPGLGRLSGTIVKGKSDITLEFVAPCGGKATGSAAIASGRIDAAFAGSPTTALGRDPPRPGRR